LASLNYVKITEAPKGSSREREAGKKFHREKRKKCRKPRKEYLVEVDKVGGILSHN